MSWVIGLVIVMFGSLCGAIGDNLVRKAYLIYGPTVKSSILLRNPFFLIGMFLTTVVDAVSTIAALYFAPSAIVTPFAAVHIFLTLIIARLWLKEPMGNWEYFGSTLLIVGVIIIVVFAGKSSDFENIAAFGPYIQTTKAKIYFLSVTFLIILFIALSTNFFSKRIPRYNYICKRFSTAAASGILGGNTNLSAKVLTVAMSTMFDHTDPAYKDWRTYVVLFSTGTLALGQLFFLNLGLKNYPAGFVIPVTNSFLVATGIVGGIMFLDEIPYEYGLLSLALVLLGLAIIIMGIFIFTWKHGVPHLLTAEQLTTLQSIGSNQFRLDPKPEMGGASEIPNLPSSSSFLSSSSIPQKSLVFSSCAYLTIHSFQDQYQASKTVTNLSYISSESFHSHSNNRFSRKLTENEVELNKFDHHSIFSASSETRSGDV